MTTQSILSPMPTFNGLDGNPLSGGYVYIGLPGQDPRQYPSDVFYDSDLTVPATQPLRTTAGYVYHNGGPASVWVDGAAHSLMVIDSRLRQVMYVRSFLGGVPGVIQATTTVDRFSGTGSSAPYTLSVTPANENDTDVYVDGEYQQKNTYSVAGNVLTITAASGTDNVEVNTRVLLDFASTAADLAAYVAEAQDLAEAADTSADAAAASEAGVHADALDALGYKNQALQYRNDALAAVATGGITAFYDTYALANAALAGITANAYIEVLEDDNKGGRRSIYQKSGGVLVWKAFADGPQSGNAGLGAMIRRTNGVIVHFGDSGTNGRPAYRNAYTADWLSSGGIFEGWTSYNLGQNGSILSDWATIEVANADNPTYSSLPAADYDGTDPGAGRLARGINANPDLILIRLGTNDVNSPGNRAAVGTEALLRTNLALLVNFLLARTHASIWLVMPQPMAGDDFITGGVNITQWANVAEAAEMSRRLRQVYSEWIGASDRVEVFHSHQALYGNSCDAFAVNSQDPYGEGALLSDSLHCSDLGNRRLVQMMSMQADVSYPRTPIFTIEPIAIPKDAVWTGTLFARTTMGAGTSGTLNLDLSPTNVVGGATFAAVSEENQPSSLRKKRAIEDAAKTANLAVFRQLLGLVRKTSLKAYNWATGTTYDLTGVTLSSLVTATEPHYATLNITSGATLLNLGGGNITFYVTNAADMPFALPRSFTTCLTTTARTSGPPYSGFPISTGFAFRKPHASTPVVTVYEQNQGDRRYVGAEGTFAAPGMALGTFTWTSLGARAAFVWDPTNFPSGGPRTITTTWIEAVVTTGSIATEFSAIGPDLVFTT